MTPFTARSFWFAPALLALVALLIPLTGCGSDDGSSGVGAQTIIAFTAPDHESYHDRQQVLVEGIAENTEEIDLNGETVPVHDGEWEEMLSFDDDGLHTITASASGIEESIDVIIDTQIPEVIIESPARGTMIDSNGADNEVLVQGHLGDIGPSELLYINIGGELLSQDDDLDDGHFEYPVSLHEGLNTITIDIMDNARNQIEHHRAVIYGPLVESDSPVDEALRLDVDNPTGLDALSDIIDAYVQPELIEGFIEEGLEIQDGISVDLHELSWSSIDVDITPHDGYLELSLTLHDLVVDGTFNLGDGGIDGSITIGELTVDMDLSIAPNDAGDDLDIEILDDQIDLDDITVNIDGQDQDWAEPLLAAAIGFAFNEFVGELINENLFDPELLTQEIELLGRTLVITLILEDILISSSGVVAYIGLEFPGDKASMIADVPGALHRERPDGLVSNIERPFLFHTHRTALDRVVHALWQSGLFHQNLGGDELGDFELPIDLTAGGLATLMDSRIRDIHDSDTPAELHLRPLLPPVTQMGNDLDATVELGDLLIDFKLRPEPGVTTHFLTVALQLELLIDIDVSDDEVDLDLDIEIIGDVEEEPLFSISEDDSVDVLQSLLGLLPNLLSDELTIESETDLGWASITRPAVDIQERQRLSVGIDIEANQDFIEDDDVDLDD